MATITAPNQRASYFRRQSTGPRIENQYIRTRTKLAGGGSRTVTTHYTTPKEPQRKRRQITPGELAPTNIGEKAGGVGALEAEFIICLALLVLLMFANSASSYGERVMSLMKRGSLVCLLFFLLAIISQIGPNAERIAKGFGGLVIVAILLTTPMNTVIKDVDSLIKNDWVGTTETGGDTAASADKGTSTSANNSAEQAAIAEANSLGLPGDLAALLPQGLLEKIGAGADKGASWLKNFFAGFAP